MSILQACLLASDGHHPKFLEFSWKSTIFDIFAVCIICSRSLLNLSNIFNIHDITDGFNMRESVNITLDQKLLQEIDRLRGREKRSTFVEHLIRLGLKAHQDVQK